MKFKELTEENIEYLRYVYYEDMKHKQKMEILTTKFEVSERTIRRWWKEKLNLSEQLSTLPKQIQDARKREIPPNTDILIVTSAQNKTGVNNKFLENGEALLKFCGDGEPGVFADFPESKTGTVENQDRHR